MLRILRNKKTAKKIWVGLAIIIIPAFTLWGFVGTKGDHDSSIVGKISGKNVSSLELRNSIIAVRTMAIMQFGDKLPEIEKYLDFQNQAWERLILLQEAKKRRIRVKDREIVEEIRNAPYFQDKNGFSNKIYQEVLRYVLRLQPRIFEEQTRQNLILSKLYDQVTKDVKLDANQVHQEYLNSNEELSIDYIASMTSDFIKNIKPSNQEIEDYFAKNKAMFKLPSTKNTPVRIPELIEIKTKVEETLINEAAQEMAKSKINECAQKLKQMEFSQAAAACGLKSASTTFFKISDLIEKLGPARIFWENAKKLKNNQVSDIITNDQNYYIIKLKTTRPIDENKFLEEKEAFSQRLLSTKKNDRFIQLVKELKQKAQ